MQWNRKRALVVGILIALSMVGWLVLDSRRVEHPAVGPAAQDAPRAAEPSDAGKVEPSEPELPEESSSPRDEILAVVEAEAPALAAEARPTLRLWGFLVPAEGRTALSTTPFLSITDHLGTKWRSQSGADGAYSFEGLSAARYWITVQSHEDGNASAIVDLEESTPEKRFDLQLALPPEILVKVVDAAGKPPGRFGLIAVATLDPPGEWLDEVLGGTNNQFGVGSFWDNGYGSEKLPDVYLGRVRLLVDPPVYVSLLLYQRVLATRRVEKGQTEVEFVLDRNSPSTRPGSLRFQIVDAQTRTWVKNADVILQGRSGFTGGADERGSFHMRRLPPGWYELSVVKDGYERLRKRLRIEPDLETDLGIVELGREVWVAGRIVDETGAGIATLLQADLYDRELHTAARPMVIERHESDAEGKFRIPNLARGTYLLRTRDPEGPWAQSATLVDTTTGPIDDLRIVLVRGVPLVLSSSSEHWSAVRFTIRDASGQPVLSSQLSSPDPWKILLAPGTYELETRRGEAADSVRRISIVIDSEPVELVLP